MGKLNVVAFCSLDGMHNQLGKVHILKPGIIIFTQSITKVFFELVHVTIAMHKANACKGLSKQVYITLNESNEKLGDLFLHFLGQVPDNTEVQQPNLAPFKQEQVARMGIRMKHAVFEDLAEDG